MREAYERAKVDINASHILIKVPPGASPGDTLAAYEKISEIRERIINGEGFETVARATSDDASVSRNGGNLGYFTVFSMIYQFETVAYNSPVGEVSMPFRSSYGYHILRVNDIRPARGQVKVAHIFVRTPENMSEEQKEEAYEKAHMVYDSLQAGVDFSHMATTYSEDPNSARSGGEIPWFGTGRMIPEFETACFSLDQKGDFTRPFKSFYGWHIVKLIDKKGIGTYEEMKPELQEKANRGDRRRYQTEKYVGKLKEEYGFAEYPDGLLKVHESMDSTLLMGTWESNGLEQDAEPLFTIGDHVVTVGQFVGYLLAKQNRDRSMNIDAYLDQQYKEFVQSEVIAHEDSRLSEKYPEFRHIYQEYHDGILLFDIMDKMVWSRAVSDTLGLTAFHEAHRSDYMWQERTDAIVVTCSKETDLAGVRKAYKKILKGKLDQEKLNSKFCSNDTVQCIVLERVLVEEGENEMVDALKGQPGPGPVVRGEENDIFVIVDRVIPPQPKELNEARGQITSDYQTYLEEKWIEELRQKYPVEVIEEVLAGIKP